MLDIGFYTMTTGAPAVPLPSSSSQRHKISFIMNNTNISPFAPAATVPTTSAPDVAVQTATASTSAWLSSLASTSAASALTSSSEAAPSRRGIKRKFVSQYPGMSRIDLYKRPREDPPQKKPRKVEKGKQRKPKSQKSEDGR